MEILQLPILALEERIEQEMEENPILELAEEDPNLPDEEEERESPDEPTDEERELVIDETTDNEDDFERLMKMDEEWPDHFEERSRPSRARMEEDGQRKLDTMANMVARPQSLNDYLHDQLGWFDLSAPLREMTDKIIYNLDSNGYLQSGLEDLVDPNDVERDMPLARQALRLVQGLDPPGIGARNLRECLLLQLTPSPRSTPALPLDEQLRTLITGHLEDIEHNRLPLISRRTGYSIELIQQTIKELSKLNPKPGAIFQDTAVPTVTPDVFIDRLDEGGYQVRLETGRTPSLFISPFYRKLVETGQANKETRDYIKRKVEAARWLIDSIDQRRGTLTRVAQAIVDHQREFLDKGREAIEPLKMQQIADKVGVHVTTVSRAVDDKWIQTPRGIFPLKRFFGGGTVAADGEEVAWDAVRLKLQEVVDNEDKSHPFSDEDLMKELAQAGIKVARRTVTKYRKSMKIPSSRQRRDWLASSPDEGEKAGV